jgi:hypothetical protein
LLDLPSIVGAGSLTKPAPSTSLIALHPLTGIFGDDVQCAVELPVSAAVEAVAFASPGGGWDWSDARHSGEMGVAGEALGTGGLSDENGGGERAAAGLCEQLRAMDVDEVAQLALECLSFAC